MRGAEENTMHTDRAHDLSKLLTFVLVAALIAAVLAPAAAGAEAHPRVLMDTDLGDIVLEIYLDSAPVSASNFLAYVDQNLFVGAHFYRVVTMDNQPDNDVKIEVIQGGLGFEAEDRRPPIGHETTATTGIKHLDGVLSMARLGPGTATSEFFVCVGDQPELDFGGARNPDGQGFAAFGRVVEGMDVVRTIQQGKAEGQMLVETVAIKEIRRLPLLGDESQSR
jgi:peptidyl-prolyl cis-trans isomerase A (cyclophilin A)